MEDRRPLARRKRIRIRWYRVSVAATAAAATIPMQSMIPNRRAEGRPIVPSQIGSHRSRGLSQDSSSSTPHDWLLWALTGPALGLEDDLVKAG
jgi:hypothetical protein